MELSYLAIDKEKEQFKNYIITVDTKQDEEVVKEAFWLNCCSFLTLFRAVELMLTKPSLLRKLKSKVIWKSFWESAEIKISGCKLNVTLIL